MPTSKRKCLINEFSVEEAISKQTDTKYTVHQLTDSTH